MFFEDLPFARSKEDLRVLAHQARPGLSGKSISILVLGQHEDAGFTLRYGEDGAARLYEGSALCVDTDLRWIVTARALIRSIRGRVVEGADSLLMGDRRLVRALVA